MSELKEFEEETEEFEKRGEELIRHDNPAIRDIGGMLGHLLKRVEKLEEEINDE